MSWSYLHLNSILCDQWLLLLIFSWLFWCFCLFVDPLVDCSIEIVYTWKKELYYQYHKKLANRFLTFTQIYQEKIVYTKSYHKSLTKAFSEFNVIFVLTWQNFVLYNLIGVNQLNFNLFLWFLVRPIQKSIDWLLSLHLIFQNLPDKKNLMQATQPYYHV